MFGKRKKIERLKDLVKEIERVANEEKRDDLKIQTIKNLINVYRILDILEV